MVHAKHARCLKTIILGFILAGCSIPREQIYDNLSNESYAIIQKKLKDRNWKQAIEQLESFSNRYPFSLCSQNAQLDLIYAYYKNFDFSLAKETIDRFIRLNPTHQNVDYAIYMRGLINMTLDRNVLDDLFGISSYERDPQNAYSAFKDFSELVKNYASSKYVPDAIKRLVFLKDRLALYEYSIAAYYAQRNAWVAVVNRVEGMLRNYPDTLATKNALKLMENAYRKMQMISQADKVLRIISINRNNVYLNEVSNDFLKGN